MTPEACAPIGPAAERLAISESLQAHGLSVRARLDRLNAVGGAHDQPHLRTSTSTKRASPAPRPRSNRNARSRSSTCWRTTPSPCPCARTAPVPPGPYRLGLAIREGRLVFDIATEDGAEGRRIPPVARPVPAGGEGLLPDLRKLFRGGQTPAAQPDRGHRHGPARHPQRRRAGAAGTAGRQGRGRYRHRAAPVHPDLRSALGLTVAAFPTAVLFCCDHNAVRSPMAEALMKKFYGQRAYVQSAGVKNDMEIDGFSIAVCRETRHRAVAATARAPSRRCRNGAMIWGSST